jgi:hypothetical protein
MTHHVSIIQNLHCSSNSSVELEQSWEEVRDWYIKWDTLHITYKDGSEQELELDSDSTDQTDWKRPTSVEIYEGEHSFDHLLAESES